MATYPLNSRYYRTEQAEYVKADGQVIAYLRRRFLPPPERLALQQEHTVVDGDRPDLIAARAFGDPELFWRLADAHRVLHPDELTAEPGRRLRITLPEGIPGPPHA
ncbi:hypothetical protein GQ464_001995 [Rhodocaloribacter litoris]|uniref:LysM domain-containing protein n=1 Tax=Rhodocaloribacter litoris TaxID=2558931 RepID=UPI0014238756|nr:LysM domain-containing protein [Rhodocaloribacter litoris]QXD15741.1 hypothetical protein GQ464_001995 [Rhodocaloribacter litoris]GIV60241.1 MAG: hypothetical protein KatS3mg043_1330 [Rhodothermaceae bacterium]